MNRKAGQLKDLLSANHPIVGIGAHNAVTASLVERAGFDVLWLSSLEVSTAKLLPDANVITFSEVAHILREIRRATSLPIIVDADNGYGSDETAMRSAQEFQDAGASAICLEDNAFPKRGSFYTGVERQLEDKDTFCQRIQKVRQVVGSQLDIIARTEGLVAGIGVRETVERALAYQAAGANALFVQTSTSNTDEFIHVLREIKALAPVVTTSTALPELSVTQIYAMGAQLVIFPNVIMRTIIKAVSEVLTRLQREQQLGKIQNQIASLEELFELTHAYEWFDSSGSAIN